jgi:hypothetical protein
LGITMLYDYEEGESLKIAFMSTTPSKEPDTYTFSRTTNGGIVTHDQSGWSVPYRRYPQYDKNVIDTDYLKEAFATWMSWDAPKRRKWRREQEANKPMCINLTECGCVPKQSLTVTADKPLPSIYDNIYIKYEHSLDALYEDLRFVQECIDYFDEDEFDPEDDPSLDDLYEERRQIRAAIWNLNEAINYKTKGNNTMYATSNTAIVAAAQPESVEQRQYLLNRLYTVREKKRQELHKHFKLNPVKGPTTLKDLVEKLKSGDVDLPDYYTDEYEFYSVNSLISEIRWTKDKPDQKGYDAAIAKRDEAYNATVDTIKILSPEEGLKALQAFEAMTFH